MTKTVTDIDCSEEWQSTNDWDSHRPLLWLSLNKLDPFFIFEYGMGYGSTLLLKSHTKGQLISHENDIDWAKIFIDGYSKLGDYELYCKDNHQIIILGDYIEYVSKQSKSSLNRNELNFIDNKPAEQRKELIELCLKKGSKNNVIVVHDTEEGANYVYGLKDILSTFKYRLDYKPKGKPHTTAVSNIIDVTQWC